jgi:hypothetical protein
MRSWHSFCRGWRAPCFGPAAMGALVTLLLLFVFETAVRGLWPFRLPLPILLGDEGDQLTKVLHELSFLCADPGQPTDTFFLGGSAVRESIESASDLARAVSEGTPAPVRVFHFFSSQQTFGEAMALLDQLPAHRSGLVVLAVSPQRFSRTLEDYLAQVRGERFPLYSPTLLEFLKNRSPLSYSSHWVLPSFAHYAKAYLMNNRGAILAGHLPFHEFIPHFYREKTAKSLVGKNADFKKLVLQGMAPLFPENFDLNAKALEEVVRLVRGKGMDLALVEMPIVPFKRADFYRVMKEYSPKIEALARTLRVSYWDYAKDLDFKDEDFNDLFHLLLPGQRKFQRALASELKRFFTGEVG